MRMRFGCAIMMLAVLSAGVRVWAEGDVVPPASQPASTNAETAKAYAELNEQLRQAKAASDGLPLFEKFLSTYPHGPLADTARREQGLWKERSDKNQVRWGAGWLGKDEADKKSAEADKLIGEADSADKPEIAIRLLTKAAAVHPYRSDIPFKKFQLLLKTNEKDAMSALMPVSKLDPNNASVMNNLGVLAARQRQWGEATRYLLVALNKSLDTDVLWDNLDQICAMASEYGGSAGAAVAASADSQMRLLIAKVRKGGQHAGETRWGNSWITEADYATKKKDATAAASAAGKAAREVRELKGRRAALEHEKESLEKRYSTTSGLQRPQTITDKISRITKNLQDLDTAIDKARKAVEAAGDKDEGPSHSGKLALLGLDGSEMDSLDPKPAGGEHDSKDKDKDAPFGK